MAIQAPDLTKQPPRSPRVRLGGYAILPRCLDKGRATIAGKNGDYHFACPLDREFLDYAGVDPEALKKELAAGKGDGEILEWIESNSKNKRSDGERVAWSAFQDLRPPTGTESRAYFNELHQQTAPKRDDVYGWFDILDIDDYVTYGGKA